MAVGVVWGDRSPLSWTSGEGAADFYDAKGTVEAVLAGLGLVGDFTPGEDPLLLPGRTASVTVDGQVVGIVGEVRPEVQEVSGVAGGVAAMFELDLGKILPLLPERPQGFKPLAQFPEHDTWPSARPYGSVVPVPPGRRVSLQHLLSFPKIPIWPAYLPFLLVSHQTTT